MDNELRIILSLTGVFVGFVLSQSINLIKYIRRPRFAVPEIGYGVLRSYTGDPPHTPAETTLGFYLKNTGFNPANNTRVFVSELSSRRSKDQSLKSDTMEFAELSKPVNIIPPGESVAIILGEITSETQCLNIAFEKDMHREIQENIEADTRGMKYFSAKFCVVCDDVNSFTNFSLDFSPAEDEFSSYVFES